MYSSPDSSDGISSETRLISVYGSPLCTSMSYPASCMIASMIIKIFVPS